MIAKILLALSFFTRIPVGKRSFGSLNLGQSVAAFPIVGAIIGVFSGGLYISAVKLGLDSDVAAWLCVIFTIILTGGLHEDGLADSADGLASGRNKEQKLAIMRDSRIGSYGVLALICIISLKAAIIASFSGSLQTLFVFVTTAACSRAFFGIFMRTTPYARSDGLGYNSGKPTSYQLLLCIFIAALTLLVTSNIFAQFFAILALIIVYLLAKKIIIKNFGGITGDTLGAIQQISEVALLLVFLIYSS